MFHVGKGKIRKNTSAKATHPRKWEKAHNSNERENGCEGNIMKKIGKYAKKISLILEKFNWNMLAYPLEHSTFYICTFYLLFLKHYIS